MAINKITPAEALADELKASIENLPRTDHMTLPAVQIVRIDEEAEARFNRTVAVNHATSADEVVTEDGKTLEQVRNENLFGVTNLDDKAAKHTIKVDGDNVIIVAPIKDAEGNKAETVIAPTMQNIAAVDAGAPTNPVEAKKEGMDIATPSEAYVSVFEPSRETAEVSTTSSTPATKDKTPTDTLPKS
jgi:hypothetical protein